MSIYLVSTVEALGIGPLKISLSVEKGKETEIVEYIQVLNSEPNPIHVVVTVSGEISQFITVEPSDFSMSAGPGLYSEEPRPSQNIKLTFKVPREVSKNKYDGEILFNEQPVGGGVLGAGVVLGTKVNLNIGKVATAQFPMYIDALLIILVLLLCVSIIYKMMRRNV
jgi:hypothetical protein